jgi:hypothetical protein
MDPLFSNIPEDFASASGEDLLAFIDEASETIRSVVASPEEYVGEGRTTDELVAELTAGRDALRAAKEEVASREAAAAENLTSLVAELADEVEEPEEEATTEADTETEAETETDDESETEAEEEPEGEAAAEAVTAAAPPMTRPARSKAAAPREVARAVVPMVATAGATGVETGQEIDRLTLARVMQEKRRDFGRIPSGTKGERIRLARFDYGDLYPEEQTLTAAGGKGDDQEKVEQVTDESVIIENFRRLRDAARRDPDTLLASGGLCAPVTPYYNLQMISVAERPVRAALPGFNADRGGINAALPLSLASITTAVGVRTAAEDAVGGSTAEKSCQIIDCPDFVETDVQIIYHCIQFGNLGARTFPERVAQSNDLVLAAHARVAEAQLLTNIGAASTAVTASTLGIGVVGDLLGQILAAASGMRSRHRMNPDAVLRVLLPRWILDEMLSDVIRSQFQRFDMTATQFIGLLREANVEPSFYIDGAAGASQVFGTQAAGALLSFPANVVWYIYPEGSFLYLDGGTLELGIVRDSILNSTNDFQIFGESFENVAFIGVESLEVTSGVCDSGAVTAPVDVTGCGSY